MSNNFYIHNCSNKIEWKAAKHFRNKYFFSPYGIKDPYKWTFNHPDHAHLILYWNIKIIGYAHLQFWPDARAAIRIIVIEEEKRNQKIGSHFLNLCENWLKERGIKIIHAEARPVSINFFIKNEYKKMLFNDPYFHSSDSQDIPVGKIL